MRSVVDKSFHNLDLINCWGYLTKSGGFHKGAFLMPRTLFSRKHATLIYGEIGYTRSPGQSYCTLQTAYCMSYKDKVENFERPYFYAPQAGTTNLPHIDINNFALLGA